MAPSNYRVTRIRGANQVNANVQAIGTKADARWATGRNVKRDLGWGKWDIVDVWTCKQRGPDGKVETVKQGVSRERAQRFVDTGSIWAEGEI